CAGGPFFLPMDYC
nr:immunoglobulin heavy chain junction region [Macaca mulatta]